MMCPTNNSNFTDKKYQLSLKKIPDSWELLKKKKKKEMETVKDQIFLAVIRWLIPLIPKTRKFGHILAKVPTTAMNWFSVQDASSLSSLRRKLGVHGSDL